jgi:O-antigen ligase
MIILAVWQKSLIRQKKILEIILTGGVLIFILFNLYSDLGLTRLSNYTRLEIKSGVERAESYKISKELIKKHWLFGAGIGNYTTAVHSELTDDKESWYYQPVHNVFLLVFAEIGVLGFLLFMTFLLFTFYFLLKNYKKAENLNFYKIGLLIAIISMFLIDHWWWSLHFGVLFFWLVMGLMFKKRDV